MPDKLNFMFERLVVPTDLLSDALMEARLSGVLTSRTSLQPPFALAFGEDVRRPGFHFALAGECWVIPRGKAPVRFSTGDIALLPHGAAHVLADDPATPAISVESLAITLPPGGRAALPFGREGPAAEVLCGAYDISAGAVPWLHGQPDLVHIAAAKTKASPLSALLRMLSAEAAAPGPGSALIQARLIDLVFVVLLVMAPSYLEVGASGKPGAVHVDRSGAPNALCSDSCERMPLARKQVPITVPGQPAGD